LKSLINFPYHCGEPGLVRRALLLGGLSLAAAAACRREPELPKLGTIEQFALSDQDGRPFGTSELRGKVWVASFFFTRCPTICPRLIAAMRELQKRALAEKVELELVSFSVDPDNDTPPVLKAYARKQDADLASWSFLTGDSKVIETTAVRGFKLALESHPDAGAEHFGILHGSHLALVDRALTIRGYYRSTEPDERSHLLDDARRL
jgi:protein SCO1/2